MLQIKKLKEQLETYVPEEANRVSNPVAVEVTYRLAGNKMPVQDKIEQMSVSGENIFSKVERQNGNKLRSFQAVKGENAIPIPGSRIKL